MMQPADNHQTNRLSEVNPPKNKFFWLWLNNGLPLYKVVEKVYHILQMLPPHVPVQVLTDVLDSQICFQFPIFKK